MGHRVHSRLAVLFTKDVLQADPPLEELLSSNECSVRHAESAPSLSFESSHCRGRYAPMGSLAKQDLDVLNQISTGNAPALQEKYYGAILFHYHLGGVPMEEVDEECPPSEIACDRNRLARAIERAYGQDIVHLLRET